MYNNPLKFTDPTGNKNRQEEEEEKKQEQQKKENSKAGRSSDKHREASGATTAKKGSRGAPRADNNDGSTEINVAFYDEGVAQLDLKNNTIRAGSETLKKYANKFASKGHVWGVDSEYEIISKLEKYKGKSIKGVYIFLHGKPGKLEFVEGVELDGEPISERGWKSIGEALPPGTKIHLMVCAFAGQGREGFMKTDGIRKFAEVASWTNHSVTAYDKSMRPYGEWLHGNMYEARPILNRRRDVGGVMMWFTGGSKPNQTYKDWRLDRYYSGSLHEKYRRPKE